MHTTLSFLTLLLTAAVSSAPLEARSAAPVNQATLSLIEQLEGFEANFYNDVNGEKTIGKHHVLPRLCL